MPKILWLIKIVVYLCTENKFNQKLKDMKARKESFETVMSLSLQNSFSVLKREDGIEMEVTVGIKNEGYGYFEMYDKKTSGENWYAEGGLWFKNNRLVDYDGVFSIAKPIVDKLEEWGYNVEDFK